MIEEMSSSIKGYLSRIEQRLETMEVSTKSTEQVSVIAAGLLKLAMQRHIDYTPTPYNYANYSSAC
jgi:hypothetical protein